MNCFALLLASVFFLPNIPLFSRSAPGPVNASSLSPDSPETLLFLAWDEEVGRVSGQESDSWGPMSFAVRSDGGLLVLDQVNLRVLEFDPAGRSLGSIPLPGATFDDIAIMNDRVIVVLDRLVTRTLLVLDSNGAILDELFLPGRGIVNTGNITAMFSGPDGIWLEVANEYSVRVLDRHLRPEPRLIIPGRPASGHRSLNGSLTADGGVTIGFQDRQARRPQNRHNFTPRTDPARRIVHLDADAIVWHETLFDSVSPFRVRREGYILVFLDKSGNELDHHFSPWVLTDLDQRVEFRSTSEGDLVQMFFSYDGVFFVKWNRRRP